MIDNNMPAEGTSPEAGISAFAVGLIRCDECGDWVEDGWFWCVPCARRLFRKNSR